MICSFEDIFLVGGSHKFGLNKFNGWLFFSQSPVEVKVTTIPNLNFAFGEVLIGQDIHNLTLISRKVIPKILYEYLYFV